jgi:hypothetical protein
VAIVSERQLVQNLLDAAGTTYAAETGIELENKPSPLYRLLVLAVLLSTRIKAELALSAARELREYRTPQRMRDATWQQRVDALGRAHYRRYDESTATALGRGAQLLLDTYQGDLRKLRARADGDPDLVREKLLEFPRLGPVGADVFCREAQLVWPELRPYFDRKALDGAERVGLPANPDRLAGHVEGHELSRLAAALVRVSRDKALVADVRSAA